jgi:hypothetical protein
MEAMPSPKQAMRNTLFEKVVGDDMNFSWVNAAIFIQYTNNSFIEDNKDKYSREDWDEIKLMYVALDSRKNTVEKKEGLLLKTIENCYSKPNLHQCTLQKNGSKI